MKIDSIVNGIVLDHITAGKCMQVYEALKLGEMDCSIAIIKNVKSQKMGKKDIIKIDEDFDINLDVLGYIDPNITVSFISAGKTSRKTKPTLPERLVNVEKCKNPRCITTVEQDIDQVFYLADKENHIYRCLYCESKKEN